MSDDELIEMYGKMSIALDRIEECHEFTPLIPEVRSNLVFARKEAKTPEDVLAIDGRITVVNHLPHAAGRARFGASSHMARLIIEIREYSSSFRAGINFANTPNLTQWLAEYCKKNNWTFSVIDRRNEPENIRQAEGASMEWKVREAIRAAGGRTPKIFYETGAIGKEPVSVLIGRDPLEIADQICTIATLYHDSR